MSSSTNIIPKDCSYGCKTRIYWDNSQSIYLEVFTKQKHICKNRPNNNNNINKSSSTYTPKPTYYNKYSKQPKPKMSNSLELLSGSISEVQKKYEILSDIVSEFNGLVFGSQSHIGANNTISIVVYFGVPEGKLNDFKQKFNNRLLFILDNKIIDRFFDCLYLTTLLFCLVIFIILHLLSYFLFL